MSLTKFTGTNLGNTKLNNNFFGALSIACQNHIKALLLAAQTYGKDFTDIWGEAYTDIDGRNNSVQYLSSLNTASFITNKYVPSLTSTRAGTTDSSSVSPGSISNLSNAFDGNKTTYAESLFYGTGTVTVTMGKTFTSRTIKFVKVRVVGAINNSSGHNPSITITLEKYNGSTWSTEATLIADDGTSPSREYNSIYYGNMTSCQGLRVKCVTSYSYTNREQMCDLYEFDFGEFQADGLVYHTIPTGTFATNVSSGYFKSLVANTETGASIQWKLTNAGEDSGYFNDGEVGEFTAFTSEPTTLIIKLAPKSSSPTAGYPAIYGVAGVAL